MSQHRAEKHTHAMQVACVVAAAGMSRRMGKPKQLLPWGDKLVLSAVIENLAEAGASPIICVLGHQSDIIRSALGDTGAIYIENTGYQQGDMIVSYQLGIKFLLDIYQEHKASDYCTVGALLALSDQPHVSAGTLRKVIAGALENRDAIVIPSYAMRRGHPIYLPRRLWLELAQLPRGSTLRTLLSAHSKEIEHHVVDDGAILRDMDTPADYDERLEESGVTGQ